LRLLLRHSQWWDRLSAEDHQLLHELGGDHGMLVGWIERAVVEQGHLPWSAIHEALRGHASFEFACRLVGSMPTDEINTPAELQQVMQRLWINRLETEAARAAQAGDIEALRGLRARIDSLRGLTDAAALAPSSPGASAPGRRSARRGDGNGESVDPATLLR
jgi:DNA primase